MRFITTRMHGFIDYGMGILLIAAPWLLGFADAQNQAAVWVPVILGIALLMMSLMTAYELGAVKLIPMPAHLGVDVLHGAVLAVSPWLFGFAGEVWAPHLILGILEIGVVVMSQTKPASLASSHSPATRL